MSDGSHVTSVESYQRLVTGAVAGGGLVDVTQRRDAREALDDLLVQADRGCGNAALLSGAAGMGKTFLIDDLNARAAELGATVLTATAAWAERDIPLAVVGQLLGGEELPRTTPAAIEAVHRRVRELARDRLVTITVDDAQEIDAMSLRCLLYLMRRIRASRILLVLAESDEMAFGSAILRSEFARRPHQPTIRLAPLSKQDTEEFIAGTLGAVPDDLDVAEWQYAAGGSPLLLSALLEDRAADPSTLNCPVAGQAHARAVRRLISCLGPTVLRGLHGLAVLAVSETAPSWLDQLLGLPSGATMPVLRVLDATGLTEHGRFRMPEAHAIVLQEMDPAIRAQLHRRAAWLCFQGGAPAPAGTQLLAGRVVAEPWVEQVICDAAEDALDKNDPARAATLLRALQDVIVDPRTRAKVRARLTYAEWKLDPASVPGRLDLLMADYRAGLLDAVHCLDLVSYLLWHGRTGDADEVLGKLDATEVELCAEARNRLATIRMWYAYAYPALGSRYRDATGNWPPFNAPDACGVVDVWFEAAVVLHGLLTDQPTDSLLVMAERILEQVVSQDPPLAPVVAAMTAYAHRSRLDVAADWCEQLQRRAQCRTGNGQAVFAAVAAVVQSWRGRLDCAARHAESALTKMSADAWGVAAAVPLSVLALAALARGDLARAAESFTVPVPSATFHTVAGLFYLFARGRYHLAVGRYQAALGDFHACRDLSEKWGLAENVSPPWRLYAAETLIALDRPVEANELLLRELASDEPTRQEHARHLAARLHRAAPTDAGDGPPIRRLTKAEQRVARLAAQGCTNREIAARLSVTLSTVEQHLTRAYQKLGVRSRTELSDLLPG
jgi:DNA-binding CsgD family transcriptional regulator